MLLCNKEHEADVWRVLALSANVVLPSFEFRVIMALQYMMMMMIIIIIIIIKICNESSLSVVV